MRPSTLRWTRVRYANPPSSSTESTRALRKTTQSGSMSGHLRRLAAGAPERGRVGGVQPDRLVGQRRDQPQTVRDAVAGHDPQAARQAADGEDHDLAGGEAVRVRVRGVQAERGVAVLGPQLRIAV